MNTMTFPKALVPLVRLGWVFETHYDWEGKEAIIKAKSPRLSCMYILRTSSHLSEQEVLNSVSFEQCLSWEIKCFSYEMWEKHKYSIEKTFRMAIESNSKTITIELE